MKNIMIFVFTFNTLFGNFSWAVDQTATNDMKQAMQGLQELSQKIRFSAANGAEISFQEGLDRIVAGERIYVRSLSANATSLRISKVFQPVDNKVTASILIEEMIGTDVASSTVFNIRVDSDFAQKVYKKLFGGTESEQRTDTGNVKMKGGKYIYNSHGIVVECADAQDAVTGKPMKTVLLGIGEGNWGNGFFLFVLPILGLWAMHPARTTGAKGWIGISIMFGIAAIYGLTSGSLYYAGHKTGCN